MPVSRRPARALLGVVAALVTAVPLLAAPASAVTDGSPDDGRHPAVGGLVADVAYSDGTWLYCSGTLVSPTVFVTAAHCAEDAERVRVTFDSAYQDGDAVHLGTFRSDPRYTQAQDDPYDLAVVVLDRAVKGIAPARLPRAGSLSALPFEQRFTSVGYGAYDVTMGPGGASFHYDDVRMVASGTLSATNKAYLRLSMNESTGDGGTCYGDSGGPNFLGSSDVLAATTITGDAVCRATNVVYRLDTAPARQFLGRFVTLP